MPQLYSRLLSVQIQASRLLTCPHISDPSIISRKEIEPISICAPTFHIVGNQSICVQSIADKPLPFILY